MFFFTYLARELRRRRKQAVFIALGLAVGVGLVVTVTAASAGGKEAPAGGLKGLDGIGTDTTGTGPPPSAPRPNSNNGGKVSIGFGPGGGQICSNGKCHPLQNGYKIDNLTSVSYSPISEKSASQIAALHDVTAAAGGLLLTDNQATISQNPTPPT